ncbi:hypothetical protein [Xanthomonas hydrangeae]|uniref:hypothetical protein n=1 Tax=Xanthomonas hydrangeae TaxID=2775159 RepID=UPI001965D403
MGASVRKVLIHVQLRIVTTTRKSVAHHVEWHTGVITIRDERSSFPNVEPAVPILTEVRTANPGYASAKRHGWARSPQRECQNATKCKVLRRLPRQSEADAIIDEPLDQLACAVTSQSRRQLVLTWASAGRGVGQTVPAGPVGFDVLPTAYALIVESMCTDRS